MQSLHVLAARIREAAVARRTVVVGLVGSAAAFILTVWFGRSAGKVTSALPAASILEGRPSPPQPAVRPSSKASAASASAAAPPSVPTPAHTATPPSALAPGPTATPNPFPEPPPARELPRDKDGALLAVKRTRGQLQAAVTANADFYTVTKNAGGDPRLSATDWRLIVEGAVNKPVQLDYSTLRRLPQVRYFKTLECISNLTAKCELTAFGCDLLSTAEWTGARLMDGINLAGGLKPGVVAIAAIGADEFSSSLPPEAATDPDELVPPLGRDTFVRWQGTVTLRPGQVTTLVCRATDGTGQLQAAQFTLPQPNGGAGWHSIDVKT
ncbi:MAG: molybdopterin-dependent oxidoreductase [Chloroflexota bacterium]|nr:molybdopterin-dependent oxidoreductase [Chloroflexota bacterium]